MNKLIDLIKDRQRMFISNKYMLLVIILVLIAALSGHDLEISLTGLKFTK